LNSAAKSLGILLFAGLALLLASGCADRGPTNLYSKALYNQDQAGAQMQLDIPDSSLYWPGSGPTVFYLALKNNGNGGTVAPITGVVSLPSGSCATLLSVTSTFGTAGRVINPGDVVYGQPISIDFSSCAGAGVTATVSMSDTRGHAWVDGFYSVGH